MNKPERALATTDREERLLDVFAERISRQAYAEDDTSGEDEQAIDLRAIWSAVYRNRMLIAAILAVALAAGVASILLTTPTYRGVTTVQVEQHSAKVLGTEDIEPDPSPQEAERFLQTQVDIVKSRALASRVASDLNLIDNEAFLDSVGAEPMDSEEPASARREQVLTLLAENLSVALPRNSRVVPIAFDGRDPDWAARTANSFAENFIEMNLERRFETSSYSREFLQKQLASTKTKLEASERALIDYARGAGLIDASAGASTVGDSAGPRSLTTASLVQLNDAYSQARALRVQRQQRWEQAQATPLMSLPEVLANPAIQELTQKRAEIEALYQQELQRRKQGHPTVVQAQANLAELNRQIAALAQNLRNSIRDQYLVALKQERALAGNVSQLKGATLAEQDRGVRYNIIKREVDTNRELYNGLLQRFKEVGAQAGITSNNISVVDRAERPPEPISPRPATNMALAGLSGLALAFLLVFLRERFDDVVRSPEDVDRKLQLPFLGAVPMITGPSDAVAAALAAPRSAVSEGYEAVRSSIELSSTSGVPASLFLTSSRPGEGKSTTAYALARDMAAIGRRVLLIDGDLRNPSLHRHVRLANKTGLSTLLAHKNSVKEVIQRTNQAGLDFLGSGPLPPNPAQLLASHELPELLDELCQAYDLVVIDGPPVLGLADAPRLATLVGGVVFVIQANGAHRGHAKAALKRLAAVHAKVIGAVLTKYDSRRTGYADYGYEYSYGESRSAPALGASWSG